MEQPKKRNFKVQRRIYRFIMWTCVAAILLILYREHLWWTFVVLLLCTWAQAAFQSITGSYINELKQMKQEAQQPPFWCANEQDGHTKCAGQCKDCKIVNRTPTPDGN